MASLDPRATLEEIEDEIMFQQALLDSLGDDVSEDDEQKLRLEANLCALEVRLQGSATPQSSLEDGFDGASDDKERAPKLPGTFPASHAGPSSAALKRSYPSSLLDTDARAPKRATPSRPGTPSSLGSFDSDRPNFALHTSKSQDRARERQRQVEQAMRIKREHEEADRQYAATLHQTASSPIAGPSRPSTTTSSSVAPIFQPGFGRAPAIAIKPDPARFDRRSLPSHSDRAGRQSTDVVDLTGDFDDDDMQILPHSSPARPRQPGTSLSGHSDPVADAVWRKLQAHSSTAADPEADAAWRRLQAYTAQARNSPNHSSPSRAGLHSTPADLIAQRHAEHMRQRDQTQSYLTQNGAVHGSYSPSYIADARAREMQRLQQSYVYPSSAKSAVGPPPSRNIYSAPDPLRAMPSSYFSGLGKSARNLLKGVGNTVQGWNQDMARLGNLINGGGDDDDDDDILYGGTRSIYNDFTPEEVAEDLKKLMENIRPDEEIPADVVDVEVPGMTVKLKPYQGTGLTWLQNMEQGSNKGSILADDMGLGKTVQAIALMITRKSEDPVCKTTLILAPVALLRQWKEEIEQKIRRGRHALSVFIHHGSSKKSSFRDLQHYDVVLTTFGTVAAEHKKLERWEARKRADPEASRRADEKCIFIDRESRWYRIIIDEAQCIKNKATKTAKAVYLIQAQSRLCMTGTPMMNSIDELFSLIHFLRIKPYNDWTKFNNEFSKPLRSSHNDTRDAAMSKLQVLLKAVLLRRNKQSKINGKPILVLPERVVELTHPVFSDEEKDFYSGLESQTRIQFNKYVQAGTVGKSYAHILVLLLRLRQACCHPHLIKDFGVAAAADITEDTMIELAEGLDAMVIGRIKEAAGNFECPICYDAVENPAIFIPCGHDTCSECFAKIADPAQAVANGVDGAHNARCPNCRGPINAKSVIDYETFKKVHMPPPVEEEMVQAALDPADAETESDADATDSGSDSEIESEDEEDDDGDDLKDFIVDDDAESEMGSDEDETVVKTIAVKGEGDDGVVSDIDDMVGESSGNRPKRVAALKKKKSKKSKGKGKVKVKEGMKGKDKEKKKKKAPMKTLAELKKLATKSKGAKKEYLRRIRDDWKGSAKIDKTLELLQGVIDNTDEKIIIFSQWTSLLDLLEVPIDEKGWGYRRYDGSMNAVMRGDAVDDFKTLPRVRMMLVSLKAGNAGLNLNCASQVVLLDPFWNPYIEEQAIDRAHRLGQTRPVHVHRILVEETVEDRIMALQEKKRALVEEALDEGGAQRAGRLNQQELAYLFGVARNPAAA